MKTFMSKVDRRSRISFLGGLAGGTTTVAILAAIRLTGKHLASDGEHMDDHAWAVAATVGLAANLLVRLFIPTEKESSPQ